MPAALLLLSLAAAARAEAPKAVPDGCAGYPKAVPAIYLNDAPDPAPRFTRKTVGTLRNYFIAYTARTGKELGGFLYTRGGSDELEVFACTPEPGRSICRATSGSFDPYPGVSYNEEGTKGGVKYEGIENHPKFPKGDDVRFVTWWHTHPDPAKGGTTCPPYASDSDWKEGKNLLWGFSFDYVDGKKVPASPGSRGDVQLSPHVIVWSGKLCPDGSPGTAMTLYDRDKKLADQAGMFKDYAVAAFDDLKRRLGTSCSELPPGQKIFSLNPADYR